MPVRVPLTATSPLLEAQFVARPHPLAVDVQLNGRAVRAQLADRNGLGKLLRPGGRLLLARQHDLGRKAAFQVMGVYDGAELLSLDAQLPNRLVAAALALGALPQFAHYSTIQRGVTVGDQQFDFRLGEGPSSCLLSVLAVGRVQERLAYAPDAPSPSWWARLELLRTMARNGQRCAVVCAIQRTSARALIPDDALDPTFGRALRGALASGVEFYAYLCPLDPDGITLGAGVPVFGSVDAVPAGYS